MAKPKVRTGMPSVQLNKGEFFERARARFYDPTFATGRAGNRKDHRSRVEKLYRVPQESVYPPGRTRLQRP